jgi:hypothetical protein
LQLLILSQIKVMLRPTVSLPVCLGVKPPIWGPRPDFCYCQTVVVFFFMWGGLSDQRTGPSFIIAAGPPPAQSFSSPSLAGFSQVSGFISPRNRVAQLYPQTLGSLFIASYDSQGYGGGIRLRLHAGLILKFVEIIFNNSVRTSQETLRLHNNVEPVKAI